MRSKHDIGMKLRRALQQFKCPGIDDAGLIPKLGKHKRGKGCLYIKKLDDIDRDVLRKLVAQSVATLRKRHP